ncbi:efflux RND transporter permease subunit [Achromobacter xylosoxidans]
MLDWALRHRRKSLALAAAFLAASLALAPLLPSGFMPVSDLSLSRVDVFFPPGTPLSQTDGKLDEMAARLRQRPEVRAVFTTAGGEDASGATDVANGQLLIRLVPVRPARTQPEGVRACRADSLDAFPDTRYAFRGDSAARDVSIILAGADADALSRAAHALERDMRARRASPTCRSRNRCRAPNC